MPYQKTSDLPESVKKVLPDGAQKVFLRAFNSAMSQPSVTNEESAMRIAWSAVKKGYKKDGEKWVKATEVKKDNTRGLVKTKL